MNKSFSVIKTNVASEVQDTTTSMKSLIGNYINRRYFQILRAINWQNVRDDYSFNTTSGTQDYVLPDDFGKEMYVLESTNGRELSRVDMQDLVRQYPNSISSTGTVYRYVILDDAVENQPSSASTITVVSSSSSDTSQKVLIRGISGSVEITEELSLNGTTNVTSTNSFSRIKAISKDADTVGKITVIAGSTTIAVLAPKVLESRYKKVRLHYVPTQTLTIKMPYIIKPLPMIEDSDYPVIDIADLIEIGAMADAWRYKKQFAKANSYEILFQSQLADYVWDKENQPNEVTQFKPATFDRDNLI